MPEGVRNVVMHRLLSSDRARGALKNELEINAQNYLQYFDNPATLASMSEQERAQLEHIPAITDVETFNEFKQQALDYFQNNL